MRTNPSVYLVIPDSKKQFRNVEDNRTGTYVKKPYVGWSGNVIDIDKYHDIDLTVTL